MQYMGIHFGCLSIRIFKFVVFDDGSKGSEIKIQSPFGLGKFYTYYQGALPNAYDPNTKAVGYKAIKQVGIKGVERFDKKFFQGLLHNNGTSDGSVLIWKNFINEVFKNYRLGEDCDPIKVTIYLEDIDFTIQRNKGMPWMGVDDFSRKVFNLLKGEWRKFRQDDLLFLSQKEKAEIVRTFVKINFQINQDDLFVIIGNQNTSMFKYTNNNSKVILSCGPGVNQLYSKCLNYEEQEIYQIINLCNQEGIELSKACMKNLQYWKNDILSQMNLSFTKGSDFGQCNSVWIGGEGANLFNRISNTMHLTSDKVFKLPDPLLVFASGAALYHSLIDISKEIE